MTKNYEAGIPRRLLHGDCECSINQRHAMYVPEQNEGILSSSIRRFLLATRQLPAGENSAAQRLHAPPVNLI